MWVKIPDEWGEDPRLDKVGADGVALAICGLCYANRNKTDGRIPRSRAARLYNVADPKATIEDLIRVGIWRDAGEDIEIVDFLEHQWSREQIDKRRAEKTARQAKWRATRKAKTRVDAEVDAPTDAHVDALVAPTPYPYPTPREGMGMKANPDANAVDASTRGLRWGSDAYLTARAKRDALLDDLEDASERAAAAEYRRLYGNAA